VNWLYNYFLVNEPFLYWELYACIYSLVTGYSFAKHEILEILGKANIWCRVQKWTGNEN